METFEGSSLWKVFEKEFLLEPGIHCLSMGQTGTGKTIKSFRFVHWLKKKGETIVFFDTGKSGEMLPLLGLGMPIHCIIPKSNNGTSCKVSFKSSPVSIDFDEVDTAGETWESIHFGKINLLSFRNFFVDAQPKAKYGSELMLSLVQKARKRGLPNKITLIIDEFHELCPSYGLMENKYLKESASRTTVALKTLRSEGIRILAIDQAWGDVFTNARRQFPFFLVSRSPNFGKDAGRLAAYGFHNLKTPEARIIFPCREWNGKLNFPMYYPPPNTWVDYDGEVVEHKEKRKVIETWQKVVSDDTS